MKMPIPDDWDRESWDCYRIYWPRSKRFLGIYLGFLSAMTRGRFWDEDTGSILQAQAIGWEIFNHNRGLVSCFADQLPPDVPSPGEYPCDRAYALEFGDDDMACYVERIECREDGLYMRLCGEWHKVPGCSMLSGFQPDDETVIPRPDEDNEADWRCSKAKAIANLLYSVARSVLAHWDTVNIIGFVSNVQDDVGLDLSNRNLLWLYEWMVLNAIVINEDYDELVTTQQEQLFVCRLAPKLDGSNNDIGQNQLDIIQREFIGMGGNNPLERTFLSDVFLTVGLDNFRLVTRAAPLVLSSDCGCPELEPTIPVSYDWGHRYNFRLSEYGWALIGTSSGRSYELGVGFVNRNMDDEGVDDYLPGINKHVPSPFAGATLTYFQLRYTSWPTKTLAVGYWAGIDGGTPVAANMSLYGREYVSQIVDLPLAQGQQLNFGAVSVRGIDTVGGDSILAELVIVGEGDDPWPEDPPLE